MGNYTGLQTNFQKFEPKRTSIQYEPEMCWEIQNKTVNALMKVSKLNDKIIFLYFETGHLYLFESESIQIQVRSMKLTKITCSNGTFENTFYRICSAYVTHSIRRRKIISSALALLYYIIWFIWYE